MINIAITVQLTPFPLEPKFGIIINFNDNGPQSMSVQCDDDLEDSWYIDGDYAVHFHSEEGDNLEVSIYRYDEETDVINMCESVCYSTFDIQPWNWVPKLMPHTVGVNIRVKREEDVELIAQELQDWYDNTFCQESFLSQIKNIIQ